MENLINLYITKKKKGNDIYQKLPFLKKDKKSAKYTLFSQSKQNNNFTFEKS